jgi:hypothetical protein
MIYAVLATILNLVRCNNGILYPVYGMLHLLDLL